MELISVISLKVEHYRINPKRHEETILSYIYIGGSESLFPIRIRIHNTAHMTFIINSFRHYKFFIPVIIESFIPTCYLPPVGELENSAIMLAKGILTPHSVADGLSSISWMQWNYVVTKCVVDTDPELLPGSGIIVPDPDPAKSARAGK